MSAASVATTGRRYDMRHTRRWANLRRAYSALLPLDCTICGRPVQPGDAWDLGHPTPWVEGGADAAARPQHRHCNRLDGARLGAARRWRRTAQPSRQW